jgi:hypothetical protein
MSKTSEYSLWEGMIARCTVPSRINYADYGGRGIKVSEEWRSFEKFYEDMGRRPSRRYSLDRINNDGDYCKENCKWSTRKEQSRNTSRSVHVTYKDRTMCIEDWAKELGTRSGTIKGRLKGGWTPQEAVSVKPVKGKKYVYRKTHGKVSSVRVRDEKGNDRVPSTEIVHRGTSDSGMRERDDDFIL